MDPTDALAPAPAANIGKYRLVERIGAGGFGSVFKAIDPETNRIVAVKICTVGEEGHPRFFREARLASRLSHPNITAVYEAGMEGDTPFMIQEFLAGRDLSNLIAEREPLAIVEKQRILASVADGLDYAHRRGVIHRDIKPSNIRILEDGGVKVMDFGIAKPVDETTAVTKKGVTVGSLGYMSPEQICGDPLGPEADIFLLGITAYELLSYRRPFRNDNLFRLMEMIVKEEPDPLIDVEPSVPAGLAAVVAKAMRKSPEERFSSASEMRDALWRGEA